MPARNEKRSSLGTLGLSEFADFVKSELLELSCRLEAKHEQLVGSMMPVGSMSQFGLPQSSSAASAALQPMPVQQRLLPRGTGWWRPSGESTSNMDKNVEKSTALIPTSRADSPEITHSNADRKKRLSKRRMMPAAPHPRQSGAAAAPPRALLPGQLDPRSQGEGDEDNDDDALPKPPSTVPPRLAVDLDDGVVSSDSDVPPTPPPESASWRPSEMLKSQSLRGSLQSTSPWCRRSDEDLQRASALLERIEQDHLAGKEQANHLILRIQQGQQNDNWDPHVIPSPDIAAALQGLQLPLCCSSFLSDNSIASPRRTSLLGVSPMPSMRREGAEGGGSDRSSTAGAMACSILSTPTMQLPGAAQSPIYDEDDDVQVGGHAPQESLLRASSSGSTVQLLPTWRKNRRSEAFGRLIQMPTQCSMKIQSAGKDYALWFVVHPDSQLRRIWNFGCFIAIVHDLLIVPLILLKLPQSIFIASMSWFIRAYWSLDLVMSFVTGIILPDGTVESRMTMIARDYTMGWMVPDICLLAVTWTEAFQPHPSTSALNGLQFVRLLRVFWMSRSGVIPSVGHHSPEIVAILVGIVKIMCVIALVMHIEACLWIGVGRAGWNGWVARRGIDEVDYVQQYVLSMHWTLSNFHGNINLGPENLGERLFAILSLLAGFVIATGFVAAMASSMTQLYIVASQESTRMKALSKYLHTHAISARLSTRIMNNVNEALHDLKGNVKERDVELLNVLSEPLRAELHFERHGQILLTHPLFRRLCEGNPPALKQMCHTAISTMRLSADDVVFCQGEVPSPPQLLFVDFGTLSYTQDGDNFVTVGAGDWLCEHVLWLEWVYHGILCATTRCRLTMVDAGKFQQIASSRQWMDFDLATYAKEFMQLVATDQRSLSDVGNKAAVKKLLLKACPHASRAGAESRLSRASRTSSLIAHITSLSSRPFYQLGKHSI